MQCGEEYDYFFEVDGELRYDYDCECDSVEVNDTSAYMEANPSFSSSSAGVITLTEGQIIIAN